MKWIFFSYSLLGKSICLKPPQCGTFSLPLLLGLLWGVVARFCLWCFQSCQPSEYLGVHGWIREFSLLPISVRFVPKSQSSRVCAQSFSLSWKDFLSFPSILLFLGSKPVQRARWKKISCHFSHWPLFHLTLLCSPSRPPLNSCWNLHHPW